ncbi:hypothetical protein ACFLYP_03825 [Chloroflexota bacterium]
MGLINGGQIISIVRDYRLLWMPGKFAGGKSSFAIYLAGLLAKENGYRIITNMWTVWNDDIEEVRLLENGMLKCVVILDEGGLHFKSSAQIEQIAAYASKMDCIYIIPSFFPPTPKAQVVTVQPVYSLKAAGIPAIRYEWQVRVEGWRDQGTFWWWWPYEIYGVYSRQHPGTRPERIIQFLVERMEDYVRQFEGDSTDSLPEMEQGSIEDLLYDAVGQISEVSRNWSPVPARKTKQKRKRF